MLKKCVPDNPKAKLKDAFEASEKFPEGEGGLLAPYKDDPRYQKLFELAFKLEGVIRQTGLHASGMVIGLTALPNWAPVFKDYKTGEVGVQYTMDIIEPCGLVKFDYLGLKTLSLIRYAEDIIKTAITVLITVATQVTKATIKSTVIRKPPSSDISA